jgi:hypothetical protein
MAKRRSRISSVVFGVGATYTYVNIDRVQVENVLTFLADVLAGMIAISINSTRIALVHSRGGAQIVFGRVADTEGSRGHMSANHPSEQDDCMCVEPTSQ